MRFWHCQSEAVDVFIHRIESFEQHCITSVQNYPIITSVEETRKGILCVSVDSSGFFFFPSHKFARKATRLCQPVSFSKKAGSPHPQSHVTIQSGHVTFASHPPYYLKMWRRQNAMFKTTAKHSQSTGGFVWVRFGGLSLGVVFVVGFFVVVMSKLHKHGALPGRIWGR